jgi:O-antigen/teichoic acid export membrane protein
VTARAPDTAASYGRAAGLLSIGIGISGLITYVFFAIASHILDRSEYGEIVVVWSAVFVAVVTLYRPVEQLLSRTVAEREAQGQSLGEPLRVAATIQTATALGFVGVALALRGPIQDSLLDGNETLYWVLVSTVAAYAIGYFARGVFAGTGRFSFYFLTLLVEAVPRVAFALAVVVGIAEGQSVFALGIVAGPLLALCVLPIAFRGGVHGRAGVPRRPGGRDAETPSGSSQGAEFTFAQGGGFAAAVLLIMFSEQTFMNAGPLLLNASEGAAAAGFIFNVMMIARAPLVIFQAVATSLLPHLTRLLSRGPGEGERTFRLSVRGTLMVIAGLAALVALAMLIAGPTLMQIAFGDKFEYDRAALLIVTTGMGFYLAAATLNQAALAQGQVRRAAACWIGCAVAFVGFNLLPVLDAYRRVEVGFALAAMALCGLLYLLYRRPHSRSGDVVRPGSPQELEARLAAADEAG